METHHIIACDDYNIKQSPTWKELTEPLPPTLRSHAQALHQLELST